MQKQRVQQVVDQLPDEIDLDQLIEQLYLLRRLELAEEELAAGQTLEQDEVEQRFAAWLK